MPIGDTGAPLFLPLYADDEHNWGGSMDQSLQDINDAIAALQVSVNLPAGAANLVIATPDGAAGSSSLRALVETDVPNLSQSKITNLASDLASMSSDIANVAAAVSALTFSNIGGSVALAQLPPLPASQTTSGVFDILRIPDLPESKITNLPSDLVVINNRLTALEGTVSGQTFPHTITAQPQKWLNSYNATTGIFTQTQPAFTDISGVAAVGQIPGLPASQITSGVFGVGMIPNLPASQITSGQFTVGLIPNLPASQITSGQFTVGLIPALPASQITSGVFAIGLIPNLPASQITSGLLALARGGTNADLSATGGASQVLKQTAAGGPVSVGQLAFTDISGTITPAQIPPGAATWDELGNAAAALTLANADFATTFNQTSAVNWKWANTTLATASVSQSSPSQILSGQYWNGSASAEDTWTQQVVLTNGTNGATALTFSHAGSSGAPTVQFNTPIMIQTPYTGVTNCQIQIMGANNGIVASNSSHFFALVTEGTAFFGKTSGTTVLEMISSMPLSWASTAGLLGGSANVSLSNPMYSSTYAGWLHVGLGQVVAGLAPPLNNVNYIPSNAGGSIQLAQLAMNVGILGSCIINQLTNPPAAPTVSVALGSGATSWSYKVVAKDAAGNVTAVSAAGSVNNNATLSSTAINKITVAPCRVPGAVTYDIYRTVAGTSPSTTGKIATITAFIPDTVLATYDGGSLTLSAAANASGGNTVYTGTIPSGATGIGYIGAIFTVAGFVTGANNGIFVCVASTTTTLTLANAGGIAETHAGTATMAGDGTSPSIVNTTGALNLTQATPATSGTAQSSPLLTLSGRYWDGAASQLDSWTVQNQLTNGTNGATKLLFSHSGTSGATNVGWGTIVSGSIFQYGQVGLGSGAVESFANAAFGGLKAANAYILGTTDITLSNTGATRQIVIASGKLSTYNAETLAGLGTTYIRGTTSQRAETGADANVLTVTPAAAVGTYRLRIVMAVSAATSATLGWTATWTDSNAVAQAPANITLFKSGTAAPALTFTAATNDNYYGEIVIDVNAAGTAIVIKTTFAGTSIAYKASAFIERIA